MSSQFERFRPVQPPDSIADLFRSDKGISPEDAGREDAQTAMAAAAAALEDAHKEVK